MSIPSTASASVLPRTNSGCASEVASVSQDRSSAEIHPGNDERPIVDVRQARTVIPDSEQKIVSAEVENGKSLLASDEKHLAPVGYLQLAFEAAAEALRQDIAEPEAIARGMQAYEKAFGQTLTALSDRWTLRNHVRHLVSQGGPQVPDDLFELAVAAGAGALSQGLDQKTAIKTGLAAFASAAGYEMRHERDVAALDRHLTQMRVFGGPPMSTADFAIAIEGANDAMHRGGKNLTSVTHKAKQHLQQVTGTAMKSRTDLGQLHAFIRRYVSKGGPPHSPTALKPAEDAALNALCRGQKRDDAFKQGLQGFEQAHGYPLQQKDDVAVLKAWTDKNAARLEHFLALPDWSGNASDSPAAIRAAFDAWIEKTAPHLRTAR